MRMRSVIIATVAAPLLLTGVGCKPRVDPDNPDVASRYRDNNAYESDIVTAKEAREYDDQGKGIDMKTLRNIEDTITNVYEKDFERCLEDVMDAEETRFVRTSFTVEFTIATTGMATAARVLEIVARKQNAKGTDKGPVSSDLMKDCIVTSIKDWEFDPAPEVNYVHTYVGTVGEAW